MSWFAVYAVAGVVSAVLSGIFAAHRNRDAVSWAVLGAFFPGLIPIVLLLLPYVCPSCKLPLTVEIWKEHHCPFCNRTF